MKEYFPSQSIKGVLMSTDFLILVINPGSTSTKMALYQNEKEIFTKVLRHSESELATYKNISNQFEFRKDMVLAALEDNKITHLDAIVGRGGLLRPIPSGTYEINDLMISELKNTLRGEHASNLGALLAHEIAKKYSCKTYIVDPVVVDELDQVARLSGHPLIERKSIFHALNQKSVAKLVAKKLGKGYNEVNLVVAHMGGGISVAIHRKGLVVDVNDALGGEGPFSPERSGGLPLFQVIELSYSEKYTLQEMKKIVTGKGGLVAYLGTNDAKNAFKLARTGDAKAKLVYEAMIYQISKSIGEMSTVVNGKVDAIVLTGGLAYDTEFCQAITECVSFIGKVIVVPGEEEIPPLRDGALRVLRGEETAKIY